MIGGSATSCEGHDHGNHSDSRHYAHHYTHDRRRHVRLQDPYATRETMIDPGLRQATVKAMWRNMIGVCPGSVGAGSVR